MAGTSVTTGRSSKKGVWAIEKDVAHVNELKGRQTLWTLMDSYREEQEMLGERSEEATQVQPRLPCRSSFSAKLLGFTFQGRVILQLHDIEYTEMVKSMTDFYSLPRTKEEYKISIDDLSKGDIVCAELWGKMYRARIVFMDHFLNFCSAENIDTRECHILNFESIYYLDEKFFHINPKCCECDLEGLNNKGSFVGLYIAQNLTLTETKVRVTVLKQAKEDREFPVVSVVTSDGCNLIEVIDEVLQDAACNKNCITIPRTENDFGGESTPAIKSLLIKPTILPEYLTEFHNAVANVNQFFDDYYKGEGIPLKQLYGKISQHVGRPVLWNKFGFPHWYAFLFHCCSEAFYLKATRSDRYGDFLVFPKNLVDKPDTPRGYSRVASSILLSFIPRDVLEAIDNKCFALATMNMSSKPSEIDETEIRIVSNKLENPYLIHTGANSNHAEENFSKSKTNILDVSRDSEGDADHSDIQSSPELVHKPAQSNMNKSSLFENKILSSEEPLSFGDNDEKKTEDLKINGHIDLFRIKKQGEILVGEEETEYLFWPADYDFAPEKLEDNIPSLFMFKKSSNSGRVASIKMANEATKNAVGAVCSPSTKANLQTKPTIAPSGVAILAENQSQQISDPEEQIFVASNILLTNELPLNGFQAEILGMDGYGYIYLSVDDPVVHREYQEFQDNVKKFYSQVHIREKNTLSTDQNTVHKGDVVLASVHGNFIRGQVLVDADDNEFVVIDLESREIYTVHFKDMYRLHPNFKKVPSKAKIVYIKDLESFLFTDDIPRTFEACPLWPPTVHVDIVESYEEHFYAPSVKIKYNGQDLGKILKTCGQKLGYFVPLDAAGQAKRSEEQARLKAFLLSQQYFPCQ